MDSQNYQLIKQAIQNKQQIHADFNGYHREMCPHVLGHKGSREQALFCQFGGTSQSEGIIIPENAQWRCIPVEELNNVQVINGPWYTIPTKNKRRTSCVNVIDVEIAIEIVLP